MSTKHPAMAERLRQGDTILGTMLRMTRNPAIVKMAGDAGFDFVMLDLEHGDFTFNTVSDMALVGRSLGIGVLMRVPELSKAYVSRALDCGIDGIMVPMLETAEQARKLVDWARYAPQGKRGLATTGGMSGYTSPADTKTFMTESNQRVLVIAQIETVPAVEAIDEIASVDGIDVLLIGPNDLAVSLGKPGELTSPEEDEAIAKVAEAAQRHGKVFAMHAGTEMLRRWADRDMRMIMNSMDIHAMRSGLSSLAEVTRQLAGQAVSS